MGEWWEGSAAGSYPIGLILLALRATGRRHIASASLAPSATTSVPSCRRGKNLAAIKPNITPRCGLCPQHSYHKLVMDSWNSSSVFWPVCSLDRRRTRGPSILPEGERATCRGVWGGFLPRLPKSEIRVPVSCLLRRSIVPRRSRASPKCPLERRPDLAREALL